MAPQGQQGNYGSGGNSKMEGEDQMGDMMMKEIRTQVEKSENSATSGGYEELMNWGMKGMDQGMIEGMGGMDSMMDKMGSENAKNKDSTKTMMNNMQGESKMNNQYDKSSMQRNMGSMMNEKMDSMMHMGDMESMWDEMGGKEGMQKEMGMMGGKSSSGMDMNMEFENKNS